MFDNMNESLKKAMSVMFCQIDNVCYDLQTSKTGIKTNGGLVTLGDDGVLEQNPMDFFSLAIPAYAMLVSAKDIRKGDILVSDKKAYAFILETGLKDTESEEDETKASIRTMNLQGHISRFRPKRVSMLGIQNGLTIVRSFTNLLGENSGTSENINMNSMLPFLMMGNNNKDISSLVPLMSMMMMSGGMGNINPLMLMMMMDNQEDREETPFL